MHRSIIDVKPVTEEVVSPHRYLQMMKDHGHKASIKESVVVAPKLGEKGFGGVLVRYKSPIYRVGPA